jgi:hypothetical protein
MDPKADNNPSKPLGQATAEGNGNRRQYLLTHLFSQHVKRPFSLLFSVRGTLIPMDTNAFRFLGKRLTHVMNSPSTLSLIISLAFLVLIPDRRAD